VDIRVLVGNILPGDLVFQHEVDRVDHHGVACDEGDVVVGRDRADAGALPVSDLVSAIQSGDVEKLETVPGIGKKSAGRLVLELKDKLTKLHPALVPSDAQLLKGRDEQFDDALSALTNLGYRTSDAKEALKAAQQLRSGPLTLQELIRESLKKLARG